MGDTPLSACANSLNLLSNIITPFMYTRPSHASVIFAGEWNSTNNFGNAKRIMLHNFGKAMNNSLGKLQGGGGTNLTSPHTE